VRKELESTLLKDLDSLDKEALKYRIIQLAAEMQERIKWEVRQSFSRDRTPLGLGLGVGPQVSHHPAGRRDAGADQVGGKG
jgi:hypothetical protein